MKNNDTTDSFSRRSLIAGLVAAPTFVATAGRGLAQPVECETTDSQIREALKDARGTKLVLLGTGAGPVPGRKRRMASSVMIHNGAAYLLDCGLGVTDRFARTGIPFSALRSIFITHHHPDHNIEYGPLLVIGWIQGLRQSIQAFGPPPLTEMTRDYLRSAKATIDFWADDFSMKPLDMIEVHDLSTAGAVMKDENVTVTSVLVDHPPVRPAYGYRFDFPDRSIAFSGDTVPLDRVAQMARGADVLVHEAMDVPATENAVREWIASGVPATFDGVMKHMRADHSTTEDVGRLAQQAGVRTLVLSHLTPSLDTIPDSTWQTAASKYFKGNIVVGRDLMVI